MNLLEVVLANQGQIIPQHFNKGLEATVRIYVAFVPLNWNVSILDELGSLGRHIFSLVDLWDWRPVAVSTCTNRNRINSICNAVCASSVWRSVPVPVQQPLFPYVNSASFVTKSPAIHHTSGRGPDLGSPTVKMSI